MIPIRSVIVSAVLLSKQGGQVKILLMKRVKEQFWSHVAGKIEQGETAIQAIVREVSEETGVQVKTLYSADYLEQFYEASSNMIEMIPAFVVYLSLSNR
ncbi:NUDIX domain-containing protein [Acinetobacter cumulans]|jgi:dATP pyrophosphohydrolase|uniref:NUDIX domain-containing protein n=1 Tax=Acinetobacter cumulans TaxID=2136182 RepID=UPI00207B8AF3|nr:NUDIX domain-containing protein [Acinetobacter cumulans]